MEEQPNEETLKEWSNDPNNWILGVFYFNKRDKRIFPPKRISMLGWTINFANPYSILCLVAVIALGIILSNLKKIDTI